MANQDSSLQFHEHFMREALKEARKAFEQGEVPVGVVIVHEQKIIARAHNQVELLKDPTAHAEMIALTEAASALSSARLLNTSLYVTMEPCSMCAGALVLARVSELIYGVADPKAGAAGTLWNLVETDVLNHRLTVTRNVLTEESRLLLSEFFKGLRKENR